jgi:hypothetical protein
VVANYKYAAPTALKTVPPAFYFGAASPPVISLHRQDAKAAKF